MYHKKNNKSMYTHDNDSYKYSLLVSFHCVGGGLAQAEEKKDQGEDQNNLHIRTVSLKTLSIGWNVIFYSVQ